MTRKRKIFDTESFKSCDPDIPEDERFDPVIIEDLIAAGKSVNSAKGGVVSTTAPRPFITFDSALNEKVIANSNAYIVLGQDRLGTLVDGEGGQGGTSDTIDLVVGRMASSHGGDGPCDGMFVGSSPAADAARIYISRSTRVDHNFGIQRTPMEEAQHPDREPARSAIAVKADKVRIIGRSGVKIVTGGMRGVRGYNFRGETDSFGNPIEYAPTIDLIAGNWDGPRASLGDIKGPGGKLFGRGRGRYLEPIARGYQTRDAFEELSDLLDHLMGLLFNLATAMNAGFSGIGAALPYLSAATAPASTTSLNFSQSPSYNLRVAMIEFKFKYLNDRAPKAVWSRNVNST